MTKKKSKRSENIVLNVGGGSHAIAMPAHYSSWRRLILDIDPAGNPDIVGDARQLTGMEPGLCDAVYCSHNLEHYYRHEVPQVLAGFRHVLDIDGYCEIRVPDLQQLAQRIVQGNLKLDALLYQSPAGPVTALDVIYGFGQEIERSGHDYYAHKTGFTPELLERTLRKAGFLYVYIGLADLEVQALAFKRKPLRSHLKMFPGIA